MSWFIFNGIDSRTMPVIVREPAPVIRAEERVKQVNILGRTGTLTLTEGESIYSPYMQTIPIYVKGAANVRDVFKWLRGSGWLTLNTDSNKRQMARIVNAVTMDRPTYHLDSFEGDVVFYCQPVKFDLTDALAFNIGTNDTTVNNTGDITSLPRLYICPTDEDVTITTNGKQFTINFSEIDGISGAWCLFDSANNEAWKLNSSMKPVESITQYTSGDFPVLNVGSNIMKETGTTTSTTYIRVDRRYL